MHNVERYFIAIIGTMFSLFLFFVESSSIGKSVIVASFFVILTAFLVANRLIASVGAFVILCFIALPLLLYFVEILDFLLRAIVPTLLLCWALVFLIRSVIRVSSLPQILGSFIVLLFGIAGGAFIFFIHIYLVNSFIRVFPKNWLSHALLYLNYINLFFTYIAILFAWVTISTLLSLVTNEHDEDRWGTFSFIRLILKIVTSLVFTDAVFAFVYMMFAPTSEAANFQLYLSQNAFNFPKALNYYLKSLYFTFCTHYALSLPTSNFYTTLQHSIGSYSFMKIIQFCHVTVSKIIEFTVLAHVASVFLRRVTSRSNESNNT